MKSARCWLSIIVIASLLLFITLLFLFLLFLVNKILGFYYHTNRIYYHTVFIILKTKSKLSHFVLQNNFNKYDNNNAKLFNVYLLITANVLFICLLILGSHKSDPDYGSISAT